MKEGRNRKKRKQTKVRSKIGKGRFLRLSVHRANKHIYAQVIDDKKNTTLAAENDLKINSSKKKTKVEKAKQVGLKLAEKLVKKGVKQVVFDRGHYKYSGRVKALADGVKEAGIKI